MPKMSIVKLYAYFHFFEIVTIVLRLQHPLDNFITTTTYSKGHPIAIQDIIMDIITSYNIITLGVAEETCFKQQRLHCKRQLLLPCPPQPPVGRILPTCCQVNISSIHCLVSPIHIHFQIAHPATQEMMML